jgi:hypothetical protein
MYRPNEVMTPDQMPERLEAAVNLMLAFEQA